MRLLSTLVTAAMFAAGLTFLAHDSHAQSRIAYAEAFAPLATDDTRLQKTSQNKLLRLRAFGQNFVLQLEENSRLAAYIPADAKLRAPDLTLFRGSVEGRNESWVRLTLRNGSYEGAIWDGSELYGVEPRDALPSDQYIGSATTSASVIYRAADIANDTPVSCGTGNEPMSANVLQQYKSVTKELAASSALAATRDIEIAMVADYEFYASNVNGAVLAMIARMNTVDGIFSSQLDVNIVPAEFTIFTSPADPFDTSDAPMLLEQFGTFRDSTPIVRNRGLAHLFTGRELDGTTVGIAYRDTLCHPQAGVSVSQNGFTSVQHALIIAHEIGHNFGATHDGVAGACSTTPQTFLMAPTINGSSTFSACSVRAMQSSASLAACIAPARTRDIAVSVPASPVAAVINQPFDYIADVASVGQGTAYNIVATTSFSSDFTVLSASMPDAECTTEFARATCRLTSLDPGQSRRMTVSVRSSFAGLSTSRASAVSSADRNPSNDSVDVPIQMNLLQAASVVFTPSSTTAIIRTPFQVVADITASGVEPLVDATAIVRAGGLQISSISVDAGSCAFEISDWVCHLQTMAPQQRRRVTIQASVQYVVGSSYIYFEIRAGAEPQRFVGSGSASVNTTPQYDIAIHPTQGRDVIVATGATAEFPLRITSSGSQATPNPRMTLRADAQVELEFTAPGVTCTPAALGLECALGNLAPGMTIDGIVRARSNTPLRTYIDVDVPQSVPDDYRVNNHFLFSLDVRVGSDVGTTTHSGAARLRDGVRMNWSYTVYSYGATLARNVVAALTLPAGFAIHSASMQGGECNVNAATVTCRLAAMTGTYAGLDVSFTAPEPGDFEGSFEVSAEGDAVPTNNATPLLFTVIPNVDPRLVIPTGLRTLLNEPIDVKFDVVNNRYAVTDAQLQIDVNTNLAVESIQTSAGTCQQAGYQIACQLGALAPNATTTVTVRVRPTSGSSGNLFPRLIAADDLDIQNNQAQFVLRIDALGDAVLSVGSTSMVANADQRFLYGSISVRAVGRVTDTYIEFYFDRARVGLPELFGNALCDWTTSPARCPLGTIEQGAGRQEIFSFTPTGTGALPIRIRIVAANETNPGDNERTVTLDVQAPLTPPPPPPPPPTAGGSSNSGGGGGGPMTPLFCLVLASAALARHTYRRAYR